MGKSSQSRERRRVGKHTIHMVSVAGNGGVKLRQVRSRDDILTLWSAYDHLVQFAEKWHSKKLRIYSRETRRIFCENIFVTFLDVFTRLSGAVDWKDCFDASYWNHVGLLVIQPCNVTLSASCKFLRVLIRLYANEESGMNRRQRVLAMVSPKIPRTVANLVALLSLWAGRSYRY